MEQPDQPLPEIAKLIAILLGSISKELDTGSVNVVIKFVSLYFNILTILENGIEFNFDQSSNPPNHF